MESSTPSRDTAWAMSQENVEIVRKWVVDLFVDPDPANMSDVDPDMVWNPVTRRRRRGMTAFGRPWRAGRASGTSTRRLRRSSSTWATASSRQRNSTGAGAAAGLRPTPAQRDQSEEAARAAGAELTGTITGTQLGEEVH